MSNQIYFGTIMGYNDPDVTKAELSKKQKERIAALQTVMEGASTLSYTDMEMQIQKIKSLNKKITGLKNILMHQTRYRKDNSNLKPS